MIVDVLLGLDENETKADLETAVSGFNDKLTGQQTIFQMIRLCEEI